MIFLSGGRQILLIGGRQIILYGTPDTNGLSYYNVYEPTLTQNPTPNRTLSGDVMINGKLRHHRKNLVLVIDVLLLRIEAKQSSTVRY